MTPQSRTFAWWLAFPAMAAAIVSVPIGLATGYGYVLGPILALTALAIWFAARSAWSRFNVTNLFAGAGVGLVAGLAAGALIYVAFVVDARIGPSLGGSVIASSIEGAANQGFQAGVQAVQPGGAANVVMAPAILVTAPAGAMAGALYVILAIMSVCALTAVTGLIGGAVAAASTRK